MAYLCLWRSNPPSGPLSQLPTANVRHDRVPHDKRTNTRSHPHLSCPLPAAGHRSSSGFHVPAKEITDGQLRTRARARPVLTRKNPCRSRCQWAEKKERSPQYHRPHKPPLRGLPTTGSSRDRDSRGPPVMSLPPGRGHRRTEPPCRSTCQQMHHPASQLPSWPCYSAV